MRHTKPLRRYGVVIGLGSAIDPTTTAPGTTGQVLTATTDAAPAFAAPAAVSLTTGVTGVLPLANGGTGSAVGPIVTVPFGPLYGTLVAAGSTVFFGRDDEATETFVHFSWPVACAVVRMDVRTSGPPVGTETFIYTLRLAAADTALTKTLTGTETTGVATGSVAITAGSRSSIKLVTSAGAGVANHMVTLAVQVQN